MVVRVSVVMAAYNGQRYIAESMRSVLEQSFTELELIVVDDGSTDRTKEIVQEIQRRDDRVVYLHQPNGRQGKARNLGLRHARGERVAFLDQDDLWVKDKLALQMAALEADPADVVFSDGFLFCEDAVEDESRTFQTLVGRYEGAHMFGLTFVTNRIPILSALVRREALFAAGLMTEDPRHQNCDDYDLWLRLAQSGATFLALPERLVRYRLHAAQASRSQVKMLKAEISVLEQYRHSPLLDEAAKRRKLRGLYKWLALELAEDHQVADARGWTWQWVQREVALESILHAALLQLFPAQYPWMHHTKRRVIATINKINAPLQRARDLLARAVPVRRGSRERR